MKNKKFQNITKEKSKEKHLAKDNRNNYQREEEKHYATGDKFVYEPTGSATHINLDGQWKHEFYNYNEKKDCSQGTGDNPLAE